MGVIESQDLVERYRIALLTAGYDPQVLAPKRGRQRPTHSREAFEEFACLKVAPEVLAVLARFSDVSGLRGASDFSVSCLPSSSIRPPRLRVSAIKLSWTEVLVVEASDVTGRVSRVKVWAEPDEDLRWVSGLAEVTVRASSLDGGGFELVLPAEVALDLLERPEISKTVAARVAGMRSRKRRYCREDWHNRWLWAAVDSGVASSPVVIRPDVEAWDVSSDDALRIVRQRTSQQAFRCLLIDQGPQECAICGIAVLEVLEAAHLIPHARGGAASSENGRLLCANHHRAFDAGLYE